MTKPKATPTRQVLIAELAATLPTKASARRFAANAAWNKDEATIRDSYAHELTIKGKGKVTK